MDLELTNTRVDDDNYIPRLKIMPDFCSSGIWYLDEKDRELSMCEFEDLELSAELQKEFEDWIEYYDRSFDKDYSKSDPERAKVFNAKGLELAKKIKQLFPKYYVEYFGEDEYGADKHQEIKNV